LVASNFGDPIDGSDLVTKDWALFSGDSFVMAAQEAAALAEGFKDQLQDLTVTVVNVPNDQQGTASYNAVTGVLTLHIPMGATGPQGPVGEKGPKGDKGELGDTPSGLAFGQMMIDEDGYLYLEYVGDDLNADFEIDEDGYLYATL
jgi:hypothetical protein